MSSTVVPHCLLAVLRHKLASYVYNKLILRPSYQGCRCNDVAGTICQTLKAWWNLSVFRQANKTKFFVNFTADFYFCFIYIHFEYQCPCVFDVLL
jgi:hypothetical protein